MEAAGVFGGLPRSAPRPVAGGRRGPLPAGAPDSGVAELRGASHRGSHGWRAADDRKAGGLGRHSACRTRRQETENQLQSRQAGQCTRRFAHVTKRSCTYTMVPTRIPLWIRLLLFAPTARVRKAQFRLV